MFGASWAVRLSCYRAAPLCSLRVLHQCACYQRVLVLLRLHSCLSALAAGVEEVAREAARAVVPAAEEPVVAGAVVLVEAQVAAPVGERAEDAVVLAGERAAAEGAQAAVPVGGAEVQGEEMLVADEAEWAEAIFRVSRTLTIHITNPA